jgi:hypothetical protein
MADDASAAPYLAKDGVCGCKKATFIMATDKILIGEVSAEQIKKWKDANPLGIFGVKKSGRIGYFKCPGFDEINAYHAMANKEDNISEQWKALAEPLFLGGCDELITSPKYLGNVTKKLQEQMIGEEAEVVNL